MIEVSVVEQEPVEVMVAGKVVRYAKELPKIEESEEGVVLRSKDGQWVKETVDKQATEASEKLITSGAVFDGFKQRDETFSTFTERTDNPHKVTAEQVGAIGFKRKLTSEDDLNQLIEPGIYYYFTDSIPSNCPYTNAGIVEVIRTDSDTARVLQRVTRYGVAGHSTFRTLHEGSWRDWGKVVTVFSKIVSATTNTKGNIWLNLADKYSVLSLRCHESHIATPYCYYDSNGSGAWKAHFTSAADNSNIAEAAVNVTVYYSEIL